MGLVEVAAFVVDGGGGGVEVFGPVGAEHVPADQADHLAVGVADGEDEAVGEEVFDSPVGVAAGQAGVDELVVAEASVSEVFGQAGFGAGGVPGEASLVAGFEGEGVDAAEGEMAAGGSGEGVEGVVAPRLVHGGEQPGLGGAGQVGRFAVRSGRGRPASSPVGVGVAGRR